MMSNDDYVKNPKTNRPVKVGSRIWRNLVKEGMLSSENYHDEKELYALQPNEDPTNIIKELNKNLPRNVQAVRGRGKYEGKIVKKDKPHDNLEEAVNIVKKASVRAVKQLKPPESDDEDWETQLEYLIMNELIKKPETKIKSLKSTAQQKYIENEYEEYEPEIEEEYDE